MKTFVLILAGIIVAASILAQGLGTTGFMGDMSRTNTLPLQVVGAAVSASTITGTSTYYRSGTTNVANLATSQAIVFSTPLSTTNYTPVVSSLFSLGAVSFSFSSITTNGFTVNLSAGVAGGGQVNYAAIISN